MLELRINCHDTVLNVHTDDLLQNEILSEQGHQNGEPSDHSEHWQTELFSAAQAEDEVADIQKRQGEDLRTEETISRLSLLFDERERERERERLALAHLFHSGPGERRIGDNIEIFG